MNEVTAADAAASPSQTAVRSLDATWYQRWLKRAVDVVVASAALLVLAPIGLLIAVAILAGLGRPVLYRQSRVGLGGEEFTILKFRTMRPDRRRDDSGRVEVDRRQTHKHSSDPRHTGLGRLLRSSSLDELPQLWNVIRGDMSLVGPRPELVHLAEAGGFRNHVRHDVRPGITGAFQTSDLRSEGDLRHGLPLDEAYVHEITFVGDVRILVKTVVQLLTGRRRGS